MYLALFMAVVNNRWCLAQLPEMRRGSIFPLSEMYFFSLGTSL
jgi:hypothetical protein